MGSILEQIDGLLCPSCGAHLGQGMVRGMSTENERILLQIACAACGELTLAVVERVSEESAEERPLTRDDVLDAHDILKRFDGTPDRLFREAA